MATTQSVEQVEFTERELAGFTAEAEHIYAQVHPSAEHITRIQMMGGSLFPIQTATVEQIAAHLGYCAALGRIHHANVDAGQYFGQTPETIAETVMAKAAARRRGAGARAVKSRYGAAAARNITGHSIR